jgi:Ribbon-helix-helix protein, copG family
VDVHSSACKHGIADEDLEHATAHATASGVPITDKLVAKLAESAEAGYDVEEILRRRGGRPPIGSAPASVESVRLDPELRKALAQRAQRDHETTSSVIRKALRQYLEIV